MSNTGFFSIHLHWSFVTPLEHGRRSCFNEAGSSPISNNHLSGRKTHQGTNVCSHVI